MRKCVRNAAKRSYACLVDCPESRFSELLLLSSHGEELHEVWTEASADQVDRIKSRQVSAMSDMTETFAQVRS